MAYMEDFARKWSPRKRNLAIERSVDIAMAEVAAIGRAHSEAWDDLVGRAQTAVAGLPDAHFVDLGIKHGISSREAEATLMRLALSQPTLVLKAVENTQAKLRTPAEARQ